MERTVSALSQLQMWGKLQLFDLIQVRRVKELAFGKFERGLMSCLFRQNGIVIINLICLLLRRELVLATFSKVSREGECVVKNRQSNAISGEEVRLLLGSHRIP